MCFVGEPQTPLLAPPSTTPLLCLQPTPNLYPLIIPFTYTGVAWDLLWHLWMVD